MVEKIIALLKTEYPDARCSLIFHNPLEALIAILLSAQCRDERVNEVTRKLFNHYQTAEDYAEAGPGELEAYLHTLGLYKNKASNIRRLARVLMERYQAQVPDLQEVFERTYGIVVDTHVARLSRRLGWTQSDDPVQIEKDLRVMIPEEDWKSINHLLIAHGRKVCMARKPICGGCVLADDCPSNINVI
jgi:endonuclease-3